MNDHNETASILHLYKCYYPDSVGGVETFIHQLTKALHKKYKLQQHILTTTRCKKAYHKMVEQVTVHYVPISFECASCPISYTMIPYLRDLLAEETFDLIHYHFPWPFADLLHQFTALANYPFVISYHSDIVKQRFLKQLYAPLMHRFLKQAGTIIPASQNYLESSPVLQRYRDKCQVIPMGLQDAKKKTGLRDCLDYWQGRCPPPFFLFVGVLRYYKGLHYLLEAVKNTTIRLIIAGDGPEKKALRKVIDKLQLSDRVLLIGHVNELDKYVLYQQCHAVVSPAHLRSEAYCIMLLEGLMHGKPLISTDIGTGSSFVNKNEVTGLIVPKKDPQALQNAMQYLLNQPKQRQIFARAARNRYRTLFMADHMAERYFNVYKNIWRNYSGF